LGVSPNRSQFWQAPESIKLTEIAARKSAKLPFPKFLLSVPVELNDTHWVGQYAVGVVNWNSDEDSDGIEVI
jgi:hypothetical protein